MAKKAGNAEKKKAQKQQKADSKTEKMSKKAGKMFGNDDIDALLKGFAESDKKKSTVQIDVVPNIPPRINGSLTAHDNYIFLHGGEHFNGNKVTTYNDCYLYNCDKNQYKHLSIPKSPLRSGHSGVIIPQDNTAFLYLFLGDFTSPSQLFKHFNDIWVCNLSDYTFEQLNVPNGPSARSGHRIAFTKRAIYVMGGFYDGHQSIKYYNDLYKFDLDTRSWAKLGPGSTALSKKAAANMTAQEVAAANSALWPTPRSGFGFVYHEATNSLILYGGYCTTQVKNSIEENANVLSDLWAYNLTTNTWSQLKQGGPNPPTNRAACSLFTYNNHLLCFGGVKDVEHRVEKKIASPEEVVDDDEDVETKKDTKKKKKTKNGKKGGDDEDHYTIESEFYNELLEYSFKHKKWFKLNINVGKLQEKQSKELKVEEVEGNPETTEAEKKTPASVSWGYMSSAKLQQEKIKEQQRILADRRKKLEEEQERALLQLVDDNKEGDELEEKEEIKKVPISVNYLWPRRNAHITVKNGIVYLYGGAFERDNVEVILNDLHYLDLKKVFKNVDLDKKNQLFITQQQANNGNIAASAPSIGEKEEQEEEEYVGSWMCVTDSSDALSKFHWAGEDDNDGDSDEEEEFGFDSDDDDDDDDDDDNDNGDEQDAENTKTTRVPSIEGFATGKDYFKSCEGFWITEALTEAPDDCTDKELRLFGFKLAKKYFEMMKKKLE